MLDKVIRETLPLILTGRLLDNDDTIYRPHKDSISILMFGLEDNNPRADSGYIRCIT